MHLAIPFAVLLPLLSLSSFQGQGQGPEAKPPARPEVGKPAPTFRLNDQEGHAVAVGGASKHWTALAFFPKAATPG